MAQIGYTPILIYSSSTTTNAPAAGSLTNSTLGSELAINIADGKLFYKDNANAVQVIAWKVTPTTAGGTGLTSYSQGDLLYYNSGTTLTALAKNTSATRYLSNTGSSNNPAWAQVDLTNGVTGTLPVANGGTGLTSFTANGIVYASSTSALTTGSAITFDGTNFATTGSATATAFIPSGSTVPTNGIYLPTTNTVGFSTNSTERARFNSSGILNVLMTGAETGSTNGFQFLSPAGIGGLTIYSSGSTRDQIQLKNSVTTGPSSGDTCAIGVASGALTIKTGGSQRVSIGSTGDVTVSTGNLVIGTAGKGIDFSATSGTGTSELLADYEEGTWTPVYVADTTNFTSVTYDVVLGQYTKIGNVVYINMALRTDAVSGGTGAVRVEGLPFSPVSIASATIGDASAFTTNPTKAIFISTNSSIFLYKQTTFNGAVSSLDAADMGTTTNDNLLRLSGFYII